MTVLSAVILGLAMGAVFGIALEKSRVFEPGTIISQMQLRTFLMLKIFLSAVITGLIVLAILNGVWGMKMHPKALVWQADIVGGLLLGVGISIAGACPGTVLAQIGAGYRDAWFTVAGGVLGAMVFGYLEPTLRPLLLSGGPGKLTIDQKALLPFWVLALGAAAVLAAGLVVLERLQPWRDEVGPDLDGLAAAGERPTPSTVPSKLSSASV
ncbi:MAG: YeeE/YedE family protein [Rhodospirillales bacterium]|nr:YeeE/YedE family protein [Rhodospirillales bacterium]